LGGGGAPKGRKQKAEGRREAKHFCLLLSAFCLLHTNLSCGVDFASKNARISLAGFFEINSRGDSSYQSVGKYRV
jgi:hypothetical protein